MLRSVRRIQGDTLGFLQSMARQHGPVVQFPVPGAGTYLVAGAEPVRRVLVTNARAYGKATLQYRTLSLVTGEGLLAADTEAWRAQRPVVQPAFHADAVDRTAAHVDAAVRALVADWDRAVAAGREVDVEPAMLQAAMAVVRAALLDAGSNADVRALTTATARALEIVLARASTPGALLPLGWTPAGRRLSRAVRGLDAVVSDLVVERRRRAYRTGEYGADLLGLLLAAGLPPRQVRDQVVTFIVAGHETVATALTWALDLLARDEPVAARLAAEADGVLGDRPLDVRLLPRLPYARAVLDEVLRLYPPAWLLTRRARVDDELAGARIPAGSLLILSPWLVHRDPECWADPDAFRPDRFLPDAQRPAPLHYLPFGAGPRICIGRDMALLEGVLVLAALARRYRFGTDRTAPAPPLAQVTIRPRGGVRLRLRAR